MTTRGGKKIKSWNQIQLCVFSHSPSFTDSKNIKKSSELQWEVPPQASYIILKKFRKIQRKILKVSFLKGVVSCFFSCRIMKIPEPGIAQLVLFMIFLQDFVSPKKRIMSEGCWLFTLEMTIQSLGNRVFPQQVISAKHIDWLKAQIANISSWRSKMKKIKILYFLEL